MVYITCLSKFFSKYYLVYGVMIFKTIGITIGKTFKNLDGWRFNNRKQWVVRENSEYSSFIFLPNMKCNI